MPSTTIIIILFSKLIGAAFENGEIYPKIQAVYVKSTALITCYSITKPTFTKDNNPLDKRLIVGNNSLTFPKVKESDFGIYHCRGTTQWSTFLTSSELLVGGKNLFY